MPTPFESALLNLQLFDLRREPVLRQAARIQPRELHGTCHSTQRRAKRFVPHGDRVLGHGSFARDKRCH